MTRFFFYNEKKKNLRVPLLLLSVKDGRRKKIEIEKLLNLQERVREREGEEREKDY